MTESYFLTVETYESEVVSKLIPEAERLGISSVNGVSAIFDNDLIAINHAITLGCIIGSTINTETKFNSKFYPALPNEFLIDHEAKDQDERMAFVEREYLVMKITGTNEDLELPTQVTVCLDPSANSFQVTGGEKDNHFFKGSVSNSIVLN